MERPSFLNSFRSSSHCYGTYCIVSLRCCAVKDQWSKRHILCFEEFSSLVVRISRLSSARGGGETNPCGVEAAHNNPLTPSS